MPRLSAMLASVIAIGLCVLAAVPLDAFEWDSRIVGGSNATGNVCPHAVAIRLVGQNFLCNGALISNQDVLTAAQCVYNGNVVRNASEFQIVLGSLANSNSSAGSTLRSVSAVWVHPSYVSSARLNNVAVLRLNATVQNATSLTPVQLSTSASAVNQTCTLCGWGANSTTGSALATLQRLDVTIQSSNSTYCTRANGNATLVADQICAGDLAAGRGACNRDEGAPLVCSTRLHGVLTIVGGCGAVNETSIFLNTVTHRDWINNRTQTQVSGGGTGGTGTGGTGTGGGGGGASQVVMQIWIVMMPIVVSLALKHGTN
ncbi:uncharacterized protein LOC134212974 [Armigeres subalbatus]|uniref:uncharacterized protein LOC134212974 n=1 Tax=Armigeres subalbatus TaxID=124917 RepID=UPI002ED375DA